MSYPMAAVRGHEALVFPTGPTLYRIPITITGSVSGAQTNFQVSVTLTYNAHMQADFSDIRFRDADETTALSFWLESKTDSTTATYWVKVPATPANGVTKDIYAYYGDIAAAGASSIRATFILGDDFNRADLNPAVSWTKHADNPLTGYGYGDPGVYYEAGVFYIYAGSFTGGGLQGIRLFTAPISAPQTLTDQGEKIALGAGGTWNDYWVSDPTIVKVGATYHMWFSGCDGTGVTGIKIGHATAAAIDGPWTMDAGNPVFSKASNGTNEPSVSYDGTTYHLYFTYSTSGSVTDVGGAGTANVGYATSADGSSWTEIGAIATGGYQDQFQIQDDNGLYHAFVNNDADYPPANTMYHFPFTDYAKWRYGSSTNGILAVGLTYDSHACFAPSIVKVGSTYYMYYQGQDGTGARLCLATSTSLDTDLWKNSTPGGFAISTNQIYGSAGAGWQVVENQSAVTIPFIVETDINLSAGANDLGGPMISLDAVNYIGVVLNPTANALRLYEYGDGAYLATANITIDLATAYKVRAKVKSASAIDVDFFDTIWNNNILQKTGLTLLSVGPGFGGYAPGTNHFYGDNFRVRKYAATEPTISVGSEEAG